MLPIRQQGRDGFQLLASGLGEDTGGGLYLFDGDRLETVDEISTTGLYLAGDRLLRLLWSQVSSGELLVYDAKGVERYYRIDDLTEPHDIAWDGECYVVVSTYTNSLLWVSRSGEIVRRWKAPGNDDAWHLNSLYLSEGELHVCAFGRFQRHKEWAGHKTDDSGIVFKLSSGEDAITGLRFPHTPRHIDGAWVVCNSGTQEILRINAATGAVEKRLRLNGWTRGLAVSDDYLFVGVSALRKQEDPGTKASIRILDRSTWDEVDRIPMPCGEVYDLVLVPPAIVEGVRRGFRTNHQRVAEEDQLSMFKQAGIRPERLWGTADPLPPEACKASITVDIPDTLSAASSTMLDCRVENTGSALYVCVQPYPVCLSYKWLDGATGHPLEGVEGIRTKLPATLTPGHPLRCKVEVEAPPMGGDFLLRITLIQEHVAWFDNLDVSNSCTGPVRVTKMAAEK